MITCLRWHQDALVRQSCTLRTVEGQAYLLQAVGTLDWLVPMKRGGGGLGGWVKNINLDTFPDTSPPLPILHL